MAKYQDLLLNGLNKIISDLVSGVQPSEPGDPDGYKAWAWFQSTTGPQYGRPNAYVSARVDSKTVTETTLTPTKNWALWSSRMDTNFGKATGSVAAWLATDLPKAAADVPTVPDDVISWTRANLAQVGTNKDLLLNGLSQIINDLITSTPTDNTSQKAYDWLMKEKGGVQPAEVNAYIGGRLSSTSTRDYTALPYAGFKNYGNWMSSMDQAFSAATGSVAAWLWLSSPYPRLVQDLPTVPEDVITWTKTVMPVFTAEQEVEIEVKAARPSPAGR